eukprot:TRINITY_DN3941_c0_g1_i1.p1 TRINITY_DN3941_c0_g1~~TRINITY_DN3941_c0_g1_i1.p1  ORF type:complete len:221 (+),score=23.54 TRINITY_DN3941_c0_g1_i1:76-738(+)
MAVTTALPGTGTATGSLTSPHVILCIRHIPCKIMETDFEEAMYISGLDPSWYELDLPKRRQRNGRFNNFGYGFVTCWRRHDAEAFTRTFQNFCFQSVQSSKRLHIESGRRCWGSLFSTSMDVTSEMVLAAMMPPSMCEVASLVPSRAARRTGNAQRELVPNRAARRTGSADMSVADPMVPFSDSFESPPSDSPVLRLKIPDSCTVPPTRLAAVQIFETRA